MLEFANTQQNNTKWLQLDMFTFHIPKIQCGKITDENISPQRAIAMSLLCVVVATVEMILMIAMLASQ